MRIERRSDDRLQVERHTIEDFCVHAGIANYRWAKRFDSSPLERDSRCNRLTLVPRTEERKVGGRMEGWLMGSFNIESRWKRVNAEVKHRGKSIVPRSSCQERKKNGEKAKEFEGVINVFHRVTSWRGDDFSLEILRLFRSPVCPTSINGQA